MAKTWLKVLRHEKIKIGAVNTSFSSKGKYQKNIEYFIPTPFIFYSSSWSYNTHH